MVRKLPIAVLLLESFILVIAIADGESGIQCQDNDGILPNPEVTDCTSYILCTNGTSDVLHCSEGLLFNPFKRTCDYNTSIMCDDGEAIQIVESRISVPSTDVECETDTCTCVYPSQYSCSEYYRCEDGIAYKEQCPVGLALNVKKLTCDYEENVDCSITSVPQNTETTRVVAILSSTLSESENNNINTSLLNANTEANDETNYQTTSTFSADEALEETTLTETTTDEFSTSTIKTVSDFSLSPFPSEIPTENEELTFSSSLTSEESTLKESSILNTINPTDSYLTTYASKTPKENDEPTSSSNLATEEATNRESSTLSTIDSLELLSSTLVSETSTEKEESFTSASLMDESTFKESSLLNTINPGTTVSEDNVVSKTNLGEVTDTMIPGVSNLNSIGTETLPTTTTNTIDVISTMQYNENETNSDFNSVSEELFQVNTTVSNMSTNAESSIYERSTIFTTTAVNPTTKYISSSVSTEKLDMSTSDKYEISTLNSTIDSITTSLLNETTLGNVSTSYIDESYESTTNSESEGNNFTVSTISNNHSSINDSSVGVISENQTVLSNTSTESTTTSNISTSKSTTSSSTESNQLASSTNTLFEESLSTLSSVSDIITSSSTSTNETIYFETTQNSPGTLILTDPETSTTFSTSTEDKTSENALPSVSPSDDLLNSLSTTSDDLVTLMSTTPGKENIISTLSDEPLNSVITPSSKITDSTFDSSDPTTIDPNTSQEFITDISSDENTSESTISDVQFTESILSSSESANLASTSESYETSVISDVSMTSDIALNSENTFPLNPISTTTISHELETLANLGSSSPTFSNSEEITLTEVSSEPSVSFDSTSNGPVVTETPSIISNISDTTNSINSTSSFYPISDNLSSTDSNAFSTLEDVSAINVSHDPIFVFSTNHDESESPVNTIFEETTTVRPTIRTTDLPKVSSNFTFGESSIATTSLKESTTFSNILTSSSDISETILPNNSSLLSTNIDQNTTVSTISSNDPISSLSTSENLISITNEETTAINTFSDIPSTFSPVPGPSSSIITSESTKFPYSIASDTTFDSVLNESTSQFSSGISNTFSTATNVINSKETSSDESTHPLTSTNSDSTVLSTITKQNTLLGESTTSSTKLLNDESTMFFSTNDDQTSSSSSEEPLEMTTLDVSTISNISPTQSQINDTNNSQDESISTENISLHVSVTSDIISNNSQTSNSTPEEVITPQDIVSIGSSSTLDDSTLSKQPTIGSIFPEQQTTFDITSNVPSSSTVTTISNISSEAEINVTGTDSGIIITTSTPSDVAKTSDDVLTETAISLELTTPHINDDSNNTTYSFTTSTFGSTISITFPAKETPIVSTNSSEPSTRITTPNNVLSTYSTNAPYFTISNESLSITSDTQTESMYPSSEIPVTTTVTTLDDPSTFVSTSKEHMNSFSIDSIESSDSITDEPTTFISLSSEKTMSDSDQQTSLGVTQPDEIVNNITNIPVISTSPSSNEVPTSVKPYSDLTTPTTNVFTSVPSSTEEFSSDDLKTLDDISLTDTTTTYGKFSVEDLTSDTLATSSEPSSESPPVIGVSSSEMPTILGELSSSNALASSSEPSPSDTPTILEEASPSEPLSPFGETSSEKSTFSWYPSSDTTMISEDNISSDSLTTDEKYSSDSPTYSEKPFSETLTTSRKPSSDNLTISEDNLSSDSLTTDEKYSSGTLTYSEEPSSETPTTSTEHSSDNPTTYGKPSSDISTSSWEFSPSDTPKTSRDPSSSEILTTDGKFSSYIPTFSAETFSSDTPTFSTKTLSDIPTTYWNPSSSLTQTTSGTFSSSDAPTTSGEPFIDTSSSPWDLSSDTPSSSLESSSDIPTSSKEPSSSDTPTSSGESVPDKPTSSWESSSDTPTSSGEPLSDTPPTYGFTSLSDIPTSSGEFYSSDSPTTSWVSSSYTSTTTGKTSSSDTPTTSRDISSSDTPTTSRDISSSDTPTTPRGISSSDTPTTSEDLSSSDTPANFGDSTSTHTLMAYWESTSYEPDTFNKTALDESSTFNVSTTNTMFPTNIPSDNQSSLSSISSDRMSRSEETTTYSTSSKFQTSEGTFPDIPTTTTESFSNNPVSFSTSSSESIDKYSTPPDKFSSTSSSSDSQATTIHLVTNDSTLPTSTSSDKTSSFISISDVTKSTITDNEEQTTIGTLSDKQTFSTKSSHLSTEFETTSTPNFFATSTEETIKDTTSEPRISSTSLSYPETSFSNNLDESTDSSISSSEDITIHPPKTSEPSTSVTTSNESLSNGSTTDLFSRYITTKYSTVSLWTDSVSRESKSLTGDISTQPVGLINYTSGESFTATYPFTTTKETVSSISSIGTFSSPGTISQDKTIGSIDSTTPSTFTSESIPDMHETSDTASFSENTKYPSTATSETSLTDTKISTISFDSSSETAHFVSTSSFSPECACGNCKFEDSEDCTRYFKCINGELISEQCSLGYLFNGLMNECDYADNVSCNLKSELCPIGDGFYADISDCSSYIQCLRGIPYKRICPTGLLYNPTKRTCDTSFKCGTVPQQPTTRSYEVDCDCNNCAMPDSDDCSKYYLCLNNTAYELQCSEGLHFNPDILTCDYNSSVSCAKYSSQCLKKNGFFPISGDCDKYYHCVGGVAHEKECEQNKHFSISTERCEDPCVAECDTSLECDRTTTAPFPNACEEPNGFYPHPTSCNKFFKCQDGQPTLSECVDNEHFNPVERFCQDPCEAMCDATLDCVTLTSITTGTEELSTITTSGELSTTTHQTEPHSSTSDEITPTPLPESTPTQITTRSTITSASPIQISTEVVTDQDPFTSSDKITETESTPTYSTSFEVSRASKSIQDETSSQESSSIFSTDADIVTEISHPPHSSSILPPNQSTTAIPDICAKGAGVYPKPGDCTSLIACVLGNKLELHCPRGLHFSPFTKHCEEPCDAKCDPTFDCFSPDEPESSSPLPVTICPVKDFLPKKGHCNYYYDCTDGIRKKTKCPRGLHFNPTSRVCDFPSRANCGDPPGTLYWPDRFKKCPCETCLVPSTERCSDYYLCLNGTAYPMTCSRGLLFDKRKNTCNYGSETPCDVVSTTTTTKKPVTTITTKKQTTSTTRKPTTSTTKPTTTQPHTRSTKTPISSSSTTTVAPRRYRCLERNGLFRNPYKCGSFIQCSNWWPYAKACPGSLHFNTETKRCDNPCEAKCNKSLSCVSTTEPTVTDSTSDPLCSCRNCLLPSEESCTKYIECKHGKATKRVCRRGQTFDSKREVCDWAHRVDCRHSEICLRRNGLFPYRGDCSKFVHCANGIPYIKTCPENLHFDPEKLRCEWPSDKCESGGDVKGVIPHDPEWKCPSSYGYFRSDKSCNQYYLCIDGTPHLRSCPKNLVFNSKIRVCDWPQDTNCHGIQNYPQKRCRVYESDVQCPRNRTNLIHPECDSFYDCTTGRACRKRCPDGLYYNANTDTCDEPQNVSCKKGDGKFYSLKLFTEICRHKRRGHMTDPSDAACFFRCHHHSRVIRGCCTRNRVFDERQNRCVWRYY